MSDIGSQAVLSMLVFPEALLILLGILQSEKDPEILTSNSTTCPLNIAIFHAVAELFEVLVTDSAACTLSSWIPHAADLHKVCHSSSPGSKKNDAPSRLIDWVDLALNYSDTSQVLSEAIIQVGDTSFVGCKAGISGMLFSSVCSTFLKSNSIGQRKYGFGNFSCTSAPDVHLPTTSIKVFRALADWNTKPSRRKHLRVKRRVEAFPTTLNDSGEGLQRRKTWAPMLSPLAFQPQESRLPLLLKM